MENEKVFGIMLDTETANTIIEDDGSLNMLSVLPYDFGFMVIDNIGNEYERHSYVNSDIFCKEPELMENAYFAHYIPSYKEDIKNGTRILKNTYEIRKIFYDLCKKYDCKFVVAHNARFDYRACNNILRWTTKSKYRYFFPYGIEIWDTLQMARDVFGKDEKYLDFCFDNGFVTNHDPSRPQFSAEVLYRFITNNLDFVEEHKGIEDVEIEFEIFKYLIAQHKPMRKKLW